ncbi:MAG TPA: SDR family oxidoreductase [Acidobacteriota bacterium]|jgi:nucleoside-diphosphate-sugar epimerase
MKIGVTGALGHIGSRFIHSIKPGVFDKVLLLDNLSTRRYCSLFDLPEKVPFWFVEGDICTADLRKHFEELDVVLHLAAITDAPSSFERREEVERVNLEGTQHVAQACSDCGSAMIFVSTTSVYGTQNDVVDEGCSIDELKPQSPYAEAKLRAEQHLQGLGKSGALNFIICRFGTIFGTSPGMRFHTAINKFVWQACTGQPITVWPTAMHQKRPYLDLGDAVRAIDFILDSRLFDQEVYNILTVNATVHQIIDLIRKEVPEIGVEFVDSPIMNQLSYTVSCEKFQSRGFRFSGDLAEGIRETVSLIRNTRQTRGVLCRG